MRPEEATKARNFLLVPVVYLTFLSGIFLILGILQLLLYGVSTKQRAALSLGLFLITQGISQLFSSYTLLETVDITHVALIDDFLFIIFSVTAGVSPFFYLLGIYQYFRQPRKVFFFVAATSALAAIAFFIAHDSTSPPLPGFVLGYILPWAEILRVGIISIRQKKAGAVMFTLTHGFLLVMFTILVSTTFITTLADIFSTYLNAIYLLSFGGVCLIISLLLAQEKIHHHGGRASSIVRGMLEHSRTESGEKRPTDLNALAMEYLNIAYHGLRAKDKTFQAELTTDFAPNLGWVEVSPQEIGRVLLNLYNNAFYAVSERARQTPDADYEPTIEVSTKRAAGGVVIQVRDNGTGIPGEVQQKIFQPFFTTKPTGEGTGLGLSLSYDIVTKGHRGMLLVTSHPGQGSAFTIELPLTQVAQHG